MKLEKAYKNTVRSFANLIAPFYVLTLLLDFENILAYMRDHFESLFIFLLIFILLLLWNLRPQISFSEVEKWKGLKLFKLKLPQFHLSNIKKLPLIGLIASTISIIITIAFIIIISNTDAYYAAIASAPNKIQAFNYIEKLNNIIKEKDITGIQARAYPPVGKSTWYMITINRGHLTYQGAKNILEKAKSELGYNIPDDAYVHAAKNVSLKRRIVALFTT